ncbi:hypothetical protein ILYODFUR_023475 [Ilyodon furcidens]|uniref:Uncharacterized protein n=1 Tax=Ilyodon furcidens TaxID=33524 RepID=A0ABV0UK09_9TELE
MHAQEEHANSMQKDPRLGHLQVLHVGCSGVKRKSSRNMFSGGTNHSSLSGNLIDESGFGIWTQEETGVVTCYLLGLHCLVSTFFFSTASFCSSVSDTKFAIVLNAATYSCYDRFG